jgi:adenylate kinase
MNWNITALVGVPGVGKTSLGKTATGQIGLKYVNYGELMLEVATSNDLASSQDEMFDLELEVQEFIWQEAASKVKAIAHAQNILVDMHGLDTSSQGYIQSLPIETICPDLIVIVEASYEDIMLRRINDNTRIRQLDDLKSLEEKVQLLRMSMMTAAVLCGAFLKILYNDDFDSCVHELASSLNTAMTNEL